MDGRKPANAKLTQQEMLLKERTRLSALHDIMHTARWYAQFDDNEDVVSVEWSDDMRHALGFENKNDFPDVLESWAGRIHPEDLPRNIDRFNAAVADRTGATHYDVECRVRLKSGEYRWFRTASRLQRTSDGKVIEILGVIMDINDAKEKEELQSRLELELRHTKLRADALEYIMDNDATLEEYLDYFGDRLLELAHCDQVIYRSIDGSRIIRCAPGIEDIPQEICTRCDFTRFTDDDIYGGDGIVLMNDCGDGCRGYRTDKECPVRSSVMQRIFVNGRLGGMLSVHYLKEKHEFTEAGISTLKTVATSLGIMLERVEAKAALEKQAKLQAELTVRKEYQNRIEMQQKALEQALDMAQAANRAKTVFLNNMSHDIRTPMNAIIGYTGLAKTHADQTGTVKKYLGKIEQSSEHLLSLINNVLDMSRIESGKMSIDEAEENLSDIVSVLRNIAEAEASAKKLDFRTVMREVTDVKVICDRLKLEQALLNVISNAIKYTPPGGQVDFEVQEISGRKRGFASYRFCVRDNGIGMSREFLETIYEPFTRAESATISGIQGSGLGMTITGSVVAMMGGSIDINSTEGEGTEVVMEFSFRLPDEAVSSVRTAVKVEHDFVGRKILVVEDNELNREIVREILEENGFIVAAAKDGTEAVAILEKASPSDCELVLMDIQMPVMDGYEATERIRALNNGLENVPIIAMTANAFEEDRREAIAAGMNEHIAKPIDIKKMKSVIAKFL